MFGLGTQEILIILAVALIIFGPKKLPEIGRAIGQGMRELRKASRDIMDTIERDDDDEPEPRPAWTSDQVSHEPLDQVTNEPPHVTDEGQAIPEQAAVETREEEVTDRTPDEADQQKETVQNAADSNRD